MQQDGSNLKTVLLFNSAALIVAEVVDPLPILVDHDGQDHWEEGADQPLAPGQVCHAQG